MKFGAYPRAPEQDKRVDAVFQKREARQRTLDFYSITKVLEEIVKCSVLAHNAKT